MNVILHIDANQIIKQYESENELRFDFSLNNVIFVLFISCSVLFVIFCFVFLNISALNALTLINFLHLIDHYNL